MPFMNAAAIVFRSFVGILHWEITSFVEFVLGLTGVLEQLPKFFGFPATVENLVNLLQVQIGIIKSNNRNCRLICNPIPQDIHIQANVFVPLYRFKWCVPLTVMHLCSRSRRSVWSSSVRFAFWWSLYKAVESPSATICFELRTPSVKMKGLNTDCDGSAVPVNQWQLWPDPLRTDTCTQRRLILI